MAKNTEAEYIEGAKTFRNFVRRPGKYKDQEVYLRVEMRGKFGGWRLKNEIVTAFGQTPGDCLFMNDLSVMGYNDPDVQSENWVVDGMAGGDAADWVDENQITTGTVFEGIFVMKYEAVKEIALRSSSHANASIAMLILKEGKAVIEKKKKRSTEEMDAELNQLLSSILKSKH